MIPQLKPLNQAGKVASVICIMVSVVAGVFLYQDQIIKRQGLVGNWESLRAFGSEKSILTIASDGTLTIDDKKGTWN